MAVHDLLVYHLLGWLLLAFGVLLMLWALGWDRARGRRRCPNCWYDLSAAIELVCPECGKRCGSVHALQRTRRRWRWALIGVVVSGLAYPVYFGPRILDQGWPGAVPTSGLIWWVCRNEPPETFRNGALSIPSPWATELARRSGAGALWSWQWRWMLRGLGAVRTRERWPEGVPWQISTGIPNWLQEAGVSLDVTSPLRGAESQRFDHGFPWVAGVLPSEASSVLLKVDTGHWSGNWRVPVRIVKSPHESIIPVAGHDVDAAVQRALHIGFIADKNPSTNTDLILGARLYRGRGPVPQDMAIAVLVQLTRDTQVVGSWKLTLHDDMFGDEPVDWVRVATPEPGWNQEDPSDMARWSIRVSGDAAAAMTDLKRDRYWAGEYSIPLMQFLLK